VRRRTYLATLGLAGSLSGCTGLLNDGIAAQNDTEAARRDGAESRPPTARSEDNSLPVPESELVRAGKRDAIPAIVNPEFAPDWSRVGTPDNGERRPPSSGGLSLDPDDTVIGVARDGRARAYPLRILDWHEVVNDYFDGPLLVTYCPLCGSGVTAKRTVNGEKTRFGVSGLLYDSNLVMYDEATDSLWGQLEAMAIRGPATGTELTLVPSSLTTWREWQESHPDTRVLLPPPDSGTIAPRPIMDYVSDPYSGYDRSTDIGVGGRTVADERLHPKATVLGVAYDGTAKAYPLQAVGENAVVNDTVGGVPVVVTSTADRSMFAYERTVDGDVLTFENDAGAFMRAADTRWRKSTGRAVAGALEGTTLDRATERTTMFWFAWLDWHPETTVFGLD
jgi:hypothetical protein